MKERILVVDDSPTIRNTVEWVLIHKGYIVQVAQDGMEALSALRDFQPDVLLLDIFMPNLDGIQVCEVVRRSEHYDSLPIIIMSGQSAWREIQRAMELGDNAYLVKPLQDHILLNTIESHAAKSFQVS